MIVEKVSKTKLADVLTETNGEQFTAVFKKANGQSRTLRGKLFEPKPTMGRSIVEDLDLPEGERIRLVDHRTLESVIVNDKKYVLR